MPENKCEICGTTKSISQNCSHCQLLKLENGVCIHCGNPLFYSGNGLNRSRHRRGPLKCRVCDRRMGNNLVAPKKEKREKPLKSYPGKCIAKRKDGSLCTNPKAPGSRYCDYCKDHLESSKFSKIRSTGSIEIIYHE